MSIARSAAEVLRDHVVLELEAIDRMYLNVYVPHLQTVGAVVGYLRVHRGQRFASTTAVAPMSEAFVGKIEDFVNNEGIDLVAFAKWQRKDDITQKYLRRFRKSEGVLYVGKAQEKARIMRTERRRSRTTGGTYPWIVESTAMVNHYYFAILLRLPSTNFSGFRSSRSAVWRHAHPPETRGSARVVPKLRPSEARAARFPGK